MTIDLLPTIAKLAGADLPVLKIDGLDVWPILAAVPGAKNPHPAYFYYYHVNELHAVRSGNWKLILPHTYRTMDGQKPGADGKPGQYRMVKVTSPELYDLSADVGESKDVAASHPDVVKRLTALAEEARADLGDSLTKRKGAGTREPGRAE
jgi:arylsulfatase